ncbi:hypothetical protein FHL15_000062 [Xylaria flabelliformis]|uniref:Uncharacterized protein n=1 Tax=Xylaria flabelliformis TaxID=2512241 RepID=A0A553IEW7_9PEZI|nr:hypothetical protein FHL15_000062 [Xylaria flabelliformis]
MVLLRRDTTAGNWTVTPSPEPSPPAYPTRPAQHALAVVGGVPTVMTDIPISAGLLALFMVSAAAHALILHTNKRNKVKFFFSGAMFALCLLRSVALSMRIVWATFPHDANIAISAGILTQAGSVIVFIVNLILAQRIVRAYHPKFGWHPATTSGFLFLICCTIASLIMIIAVTIQSFLTPDVEIRHSDRIVQLFAGTYMAVLAFMPIPIVVLAALVPRAKNRRIEKFGAGRWRSKMHILLGTSALAALAAAFRVYTGFVPRPASHPAWYHHRACYYCFNFATDLIISTVYLFARFDRRFIVPNGAKGPGDYAKAGRTRPSSIVSSDGGEKRGNDTDPEKLATPTSGSNEDACEKAAPPTSDLGSKDQDKGKGKGKDVEIESDDKGATSPPRRASAVDSSTQTMDSPSGDWYAWPFRASWAPPHNGKPMSPSTDQPGEGDIDSPIDDPPQQASVAGVEEVSSQWGAETSSSTCIQESDTAPLAPAQRQFHPNQLQHNRTSTLGQAYTANEALHMDAARPATSEAHPVTSVPSRSQSVAAFSPAGSSRAPSRGRINRSLSCKELEIHNPAGGWI